MVRQPLFKLRRCVTFDDMELSHIRKRQG
jgi:hypothetical protein